MKTAITRRGSFSAGRSLFVEPVARCGYWLALLLVPVLSLAQVPPEGNLTPEDAQRLEESLRTSPDDISAHTALIRYYFNEWLRGPAPKTVKEARRRHVIWMIEHHPEDAAAGSPGASIDRDGPRGDPAGYELVAAAWRKAVQPQGASSAVLANAARFFTFSESEFATSLLERAVQADPSDWQTAQTLAENYRMRAHRAKDPADQAAFIRKAYDQMEAAAKAAPSAEVRFYLLAPMATRALEAAELAKAGAYASELLEMAPQFPKNWNYGNALHHGNLLLGRLALRSGDLEKAKSSLLAAGRTPGSPQLNSFGPNMALAAELLQKKERDTVLQYFEECGQFWKMDHGQLAEWTATVRSGGSPKFGASLGH